MSLKVGWTVKYKNKTCFGDIVEITANKSYPFRVRFQDGTLEDCSFSELSIIDKNDKDFPFKVGDWVTGTQMNDYLFFMTYGEIIKIDESTGMCFYVRRPDGNSGWRDVNALKLWEKDRRFFSIGDRVEITDVSSRRNLQLGTVVELLPNDGSYISPYNRIRIKLDISDFGFYKCRENDVKLVEKVVTVQSLVSRREQKCIK